MTKYPIINAGKILWTISSLSPFTFQFVTDKITCEAGAMRYFSFRMQGQHCNFFAIKKWLRIGCESLFN